jgi:hypothetical protein
MENRVLLAENHERAILFRQVAFRIGESRANGTSLTINFGIAAPPARGRPVQWVGLFAVSRGVGVVTNWVASMTPWPSGVGTVSLKGTRIRVPISGAR